MAQEQANRTGATPEASLDDDAYGPTRQTSLVGFIIPVLVVFGLGMAGLYFYKDRVTTNQLVGERLVKARDLVKKHDLASLKAAEALYQEALELDSDNHQALAQLAMVYFAMTDHGLDTVAKAEAQLEAAASAGAEHPSRYSVSAYLKIHKGNPAEAERDVRELLEQDIASSSLVHALGLALLEQGQFIEANRVMRQAQEADFSGVNIRLALAEIAHRQGEERAAVKHLREIVRDNMNPNHHLARAWLTALALKNYGNLTEPAQNLQKLKEAGELSPRAQAYLSWVEGELALAMGNAGGAVEKADEAASKLPGYAPFLDLKARALRADRKNRKAIAAYEEAIKVEPEYRGIKWSLAQLKSRRRDDAAIALVDELEKSHQGTKGPEFEIFRGEHALRKGDLEGAKAAFTRAADLGDDPAILFGLAKVTFEEEKKQGKKADIGKVGEAFSLVLDKRQIYPEVHAYLGDISLWNYMVGGASSEFETAEKQFKKLRRPIPEIVRFYDDSIRSFRKLDGPRATKREAKKYAKAWQEKKQEYLQSVVTAQ